MSSECKTMRELHSIRERIYEEIKDMTPEEQAAFINKRAEKTLAAFGLKLAQPAPEPATR